MTIAPLFAHHCQCCTFLACVERDEGTRIDLYQCSQGHGLPTVLARFGSLGHQYLSGLALDEAALAAGSQPPDLIQAAMAEALQLARERTADVLEKLQAEGRLAAALWCMPPVR